MTLIVCYYNPLSSGICSKVQSFWRLWKSSNTTSATTTTYVTSHNFDPVLYVKYNVSVLSILTQSSFTTL